MAVGIRLKVGRVGVGAPAEACDAARSGGGGRVKVERCWVSAADDLVRTRVVVSVCRRGEGGRGGVGASEEAVRAATCQVDRCKGVEVESALRDRAAEHRDIAGHPGLVRRRRGQIVGRSRVRAAQNVVRAEGVAVARRRGIVRGGPRIPAPCTEPAARRRVLARQDPAGAAAAIVKGRRGVIVAVARIRAAAERARAVVERVCRVVVEREWVGAPRIDGRAKSRVDRGARVIVGACRVHAANELARCRGAREGVEGAVRVGICRSGAQHGAHSAGRQAARRGARTTREGSGRSRRAIIGGVRIGAADDDGDAHAGQQRRGVIVECERVDASHKGARAIVESRKRAVVVRGGVATAHDDRAARAIVVRRVRVVLGRARVAAAAVDAAAVVDECEGAVVEGRRVRAAVRRRRRGRRRCGRRRGRWRQRRRRRRAFGGSVRDTGRIARRLRRWRWR